ncbi:MAG: ABC transporter permease subunit [Spirochaetota bacterium]
MMANNKFVILHCVAPVAVILGITFIYPMVNIVLFTFRSDAENSLVTFVIDNYTEILTSKYYLSTLWNVFLLSISTSAVAVFAALPSSFYIAMNNKGATVLKALFSLNFAFGGIVYGIIIIALLGNVGIVSLIEKAIFGTSLSGGMAYTIPGLAIAYLGFQTPRSALILAASIEKLDTDLTKAARTLGANRFQVIWHVTLPMLKYPLLNTLSLIFCMSMSSFGVALLVARNFSIFPVEIYREFTGFMNFNLAAAMGIILSAITLFATYSVKKIIGKGAILYG